MIDKMVTPVRPTLYAVASSVGNNTHGKRINNTSVVSDALFYSALGPANTLSAGSRIGVSGSDQISERDLNKPGPYQRNRNTKTGKRERTQKAEALFLAGIIGMH